jgi:3',5'-cyclic AMP phosphodiesterase CpdA
MAGFDRKRELMRIVQISDTHLSRDKPHFFDNWAPLAAWIADQHPDLVIHTGDVTADGAAVEVDLSYSAQLRDKLGIRWRAVPGNHDVGDTRHARQPVNADGVARGSVISAQIAGSKMSQRVRSARVLSGSTRC